MDADTDELIPANYTCPITHEAFDDPVVARDGHTYSRAAIEHWFRSRQTSPMTNERLQTTELLQNHTLRKAIEEWRGKQPLPIDPQRIHVTEEVLGEGSFGRVMAGTLNNGGGRVIKVAVKSLPAMTIPQEQEAFRRKLKAHIHALRHCDGICKLYGTCERDNRLSLVMKLYEGAVLADFGITEVVSKSETGSPGIGPDVWAMECVVVEMHTCKVPWDCMNMQ